MKIKICCEDMEKWCEAKNNQFEHYIDSGVPGCAVLNIYDGEYDDHSEVLEMNYCPFCGKKIELE